MKGTRGRPQNNVVPGQPDMHQRALGLVRRAQAQKYRRDLHDLLAITRNFWIVSAAGSESHPAWRP